MFLSVFRWEFLSGRRFYLVFLIYFLVLFSSGTFTSESWTVEVKYPDYVSKEFLTPGSMIDVWWNASSLWWFLFPLVTAYAVFMISYEFDKGILRTYLLSNVGKRTLFSAKLLSILLGLLIPLVASLLIVYALADLMLFSSTPLEVYVNLPRRLLMYTSMLYPMIGIATLCSVAFRKPLYAFAVPLAGVYVLNMARLTGISAYIPPQCYPEFQGSIGLMPIGWFLNELSMVLPTVVTSSIAIVAAYLIFIRRDMT